MDKFFNTTNLLQIMLKWKWHLIIIAIAAAIVSIVVSSPLIMQPRFKSSAIIYPSNILPYSQESQTEQMLQWINSDDVRDSVMKKFDLPKHFNVSTKEKYYASTLAGIYNKYVSVSKTKFESIEVSVTDVDPVMARDIVNAILYYSSEKIRLTHLEKYTEVFNAIEKMKRAKEAEMDSVKKLYRELALNYGIYDVSGQSQEITRGELRTVDGGGSGINSKDVARLKQSMLDKSAELLYLGNRISHTANEYSEIRVKYEAAKFDIDKKFTYVNIVTPPVVADKKSYPKKLFVMFYFVAGALLFSLLAIVFIEQSRIPATVENNS